MSDAETRKAPDFPQTRLAFRAWRVHQPTRTLLSLNAPRAAKPAWIATALADPTGSWPQDGGPQGTPVALTARCAHLHDDDEEHGEKCGGCAGRHGPVPGKTCSCGVYATTDLAVIDDYLTASAPVLGVVELGGRVIPATQGYRAQAARIAAILVIDRHLTLPRSLLEEIAAAYQIPALVPHSVRPEDFRARLQPGRSLADEAEHWLREQ